MKIIDKRKNVYFQDLNAGQLFRYNGSYLIALEQQIDEVNAVDVATGECFEMDNCDIVEIIDAELHII